jgi:hypothetical protein
MTLMSLYAIDGKCHNAEPGTYGHECGKPAVWVGENRDMFRCGYCQDCKQFGHEARDVVHWHPYSQRNEIAIEINRKHRDENGIIDEGAMTALFERFIPLEYETRRAIWRSLTQS